MMNTEEFHDKTVVVTGGGSGIGAAMAKAFAGALAKVAVLDISVENAEKTVKEIGDRSRAKFYQTDVTNKTSVETAARQIVSDFSTIDVWINCAGISKIIPFLECTEEIWDATLNINLKGTFLCCQAAVAQMEKQGKGSIINFSSESGKRGGSQYAAYCASKFGIIGLTQSIAQEFAKKGIRANCICPGVVLTPLWDQQRVDYAHKRNIEPEEVMTYFCNKIPMGRLCTFEDLAGMAMFLAGDASAYMTGQALNATGGSTMF